MRVHVVRQSPISTTLRARQLRAMFDVPVEDRARLAWDADIPIEGAPWQIGLIVGPSGCGKTSVLQDAFGKPTALAWHAASVIDDFAPELSLNTIAQVCGAVGFNTIPAWLRPYAVLSTGERFRVELARRLAEAGPAGRVVIDEFTSVVDRQVAQIGAAAVQKYVRRTPGLTFVAATCHYDVVEWLGPDWMLEPATMTFTRRSLRPRPELSGWIRRVDRSAWRLFSPYHYLTATLHRTARCYALFVEGRPAAFAGIMYRPHPCARGIYGVSRIVTLPDYQGIGCAFALLDTLGAAYRALGARLRNYPAHPAFIRAHDRSPKWRLDTLPLALFDRPSADPNRRRNLREARYGRRAQRLAALERRPHAQAFGGRPCAVFEYIGEAMANPRQAQRLLQYEVVAA